MQASLGPNVPIFESPSHGYSVHEVLRIITEDVPKHKMCTEKPCGVRACASFVIDLSRVNLKDLAADDNGVWVTSSPRRMYELCRKQGKIESLQHISRISHDVDKSNVVIVYRQYGKHQATPEFRRIITSVTDYEGATVPKAIVQYFFNGGKKVPVNIQPHGNSKSERPYFRTQPSTIQAIKDESKLKTASMAYSDIFEAAGGITECKSISEEPRNKTQIYNARRNSNSKEGKDEIFDLLELLKQHQSTNDKGFLREVLIGSSPCAILASQKQLDNIVRFCCQEHDFSVLGIDATFNLGDFYVTLTTYRNIFLRKPSTKKLPVFLGPAFMHMERRSQDYQSFFSSLLKLEPRISDLKAYGTDGEKPLITALETCFPGVTSLRCFIHKKKNIEEHLKGSTNLVKKEIMQDIFGSRDCEVFNMGLVDSDSEESFDISLGQLQQRWERLAPGFHKWFIAQQANVFRSSMIRPVRERAQLGSPPVEFTNNPNESSNSVVKHWTSFKKNTWPAFIEKLQKLVEAQLSEADKALYGAGEYELLPEVSNLYWMQ